jgi:hypothetical protein
MPSCRGPVAALTWLALVGAVPARGAAAARPPIIRTASIGEVARYVREVAPDTMIFDLDYTMLRSKTALGSIDWFFAAQKRAAARPGFDMEKAHAKTLALWDVIQQHTRMRPVEGKRTRQALAKLRHTVPRVIALTGNDPVLIKPYLKQLRKLGLRFKPEPGTAGQRIDLGGGTFYQDGVIFTPPGKPKAEALHAFEQRFGPSGRTAFADDMLANVVEMRRSVRDLVGIHYTGAKPHARKAELLKIAGYQLEALWVSGRIPSDRRARKALEARQKAFTRRGR